MNLTHINRQGAAQMVDVGDKDKTHRMAIAAGEITMQPETLQLILDDNIKKGDVLSVARVAGIMAGKKTADLIPMCHPLMLDTIDLQMNILKSHNKIQIIATAKLTGKTGVEMEALTAVTTAGLTIYDMCKAVDRTMRLNNVKLLEKTGGNSGHFLDDTLKGSIQQVCISEMKGVAKRPVNAIHCIENHGIEQDAHAGKWHRQVSLLADEAIETMKQQGLDLKPGAFGENIITKGIALDQLPVGAKLLIGDTVELVVTQIGKECHDHCEIYHQVGHCIMPHKGIFTKVLKGGIVKANDSIEVRLND